MLKIRAWDCPAIMRTVAEKERRIANGGLNERLYIVNNEKMKKTKPAAGSEASSCPYFKKCGGCDYIGIPYEEQLKKKQDYVRRCLGEPAKTWKCTIEPIIGAEQPLYYRNKVHSVFDRDAKGKIIRGLYTEGTHKVINVSGCRLEDRTADAIIEEIKSLLPSFKLKVYDEDTGYGWLRHVLVRVGQRLLSADIGCMSNQDNLNATGPEYMVVLVTSEVPFPGKNNFIKALRTKFPEISTIVQNINNKRTSMVLGDRNIVLYGKGYIVDESLGLKFRISPSSFFQINPKQTLKLYSLALEMAGLTGSERVLDAYCGTGTIGMFMSRQAREVVGVELNPDAVRDAASNAKANGITNISFVNADATRYMQQFAGELQAQGRLSAQQSEGWQPALQAQKTQLGFDCLCMDPPRSGSTPEFIAAVASLAIPRIVYVSCCVETLARDLKEFTKKSYKVRRIAPVDMFPQTGHVETVALLSKT